MAYRVEIRFNDGVYVNAMAGWLGFTDEQAAEAVRLASGDAEEASKLGALMKAHALRLHNWKIEEWGRC